MSDAGIPIPPPTFEFLDNSLTKLRFRFMQVGQKDPASPVETGSVESSAAAAE